MPECPSCMGAGVHDNRDTDAHFTEHFTDAELRAMEFIKLGISECEECEGTGVVSEERHRDLQAMNRAAMDQVLAHYEEKHAGKPYVRDGLTAILEGLEA